MDRLISLSPAATSIVRALGADDRLVGVTAHCETTDVTRVGGWLNPDLATIDDLEPDLVLTTDALQADLAETLRERGFAVAHEEPTTLDAVLETFRTVGEAIGRPDRGAKLEADARERVEHIREVTPDDERPVVYCEEWGDPPMAAGNWVPDAVAVAGGRSPFCAPGERSREIDREEVEAADPDCVIVHHCGTAEPSVEPVRERGWALDADFHAIDDTLLNQPGPRLLDGIERLAAIVSDVEITGLQGRPVSKR